MLEISALEFSNQVTPDSAQIEVVFKNTTSVDVERVLYSAMITTGDGIAIESSMPTAINIFLEPGATYKYPCKPPNFLDSSLSDCSSLQLEAFATLLHKQALHFSTINMPPGEQSRLVTKSLAFGDGLESQGLYITRYPPATSTDHALFDIRCAVKNRSDRYIHGVCLGVEIFDKRGRRLSYDDTTWPVAPNESAFFHSRMKVNGEYAPLPTLVNVTLSHYVKVASSEAVFKLRTT